MMRVGSIGSVGRLSGRQRAWTNAALFAAGQQGVWLDPPDISTLFQDVAGTIPVTAPGQSVALVRDKSGRGNHASQATPGSRPLYALNPSSGIRNVANGAAAVGDTTYWPASVTQNGITSTKIGFGIESDGLPYVDVRYTGVSSATEHTGAFMLNYSRLPASLNETWTASAYARVIAGSTSGVNGLRLQVAGEIAPNTFNEYASGSPTLAAAYTPISASRTMNVATTNQARLAVILSVTSGVSIDITYRIKGLQFERGSARSAYQFNYSAANIVEPGYAQLASLLFDGNDDFLQTPAIDFSATDEVTVIAGIRKERDTARGVLLELTAGAPNRFSIEAPPSGLTGYVMASGGSTIVFTGGFGPAAPDTAVLSLTAKISTDQITARRNGAVAITSSGDQGTGNFANAPLYIGRRGGSSLPFPGRLYGLTVLGAITDAATLARAESWQNQRTGAY